MKIQSKTQALGRPVRNGRGRRLGRVAAVDCAPASWDPHGALMVPHHRQVVEQSPQRSRDGQHPAFAASKLEAYYAPVAT